MESFLQSCLDHMELSYLMQHISIVVSTLIVGKTKRWTWKTLGLAALLTVLLMIISNGILTFCQGETFLIVWHIVQSIFALLVIFPHKEEKIGKRLILLFSQMTNLLAVMEIINDASRLGGLFNASDPMLWVLRSFASLLTVPCALVIHRCRPSGRTRLPKSAVILPIIIWFVNTMLYYFLQNAARRETSNVYLDPWLTSVVLLFFVAMLMINLIYCYMLHRTMVLQEQLVEMQADSYDHKRVEELISVTEENVERMREARHDIKNQFTYLRSMAEKGSIEEIKKYLDELSFDFLQPIKAIDCDNQGISAILNMEQSKAWKMGMQLDFQVIVPNELPFRPSDLCSLISNVIDNALEGCMSAGKGNTVTIRMLMQGEELLLEVSNPTEKEEGFLEEMHSTKPDSESHGFGTKIIRRIVEKYHGYLSYRIQDGVFCFTCVLNAEKSGGENG